ncbi:MAG: phytanoyl-CoA dioxygenase [Candidimonas sp.]|nr:MAG: phytanoyl-CoA dioxygenase [Candidimonas sp.]TAM19960.1 MAG: phytanoyl-CoA dioxygenase [Candidimonas sp.]TAM76426.1 MAG: phytanoyl-CoA dioxygenase [Candidimonas sp.]
MDEQREFVARLDADGAVCLRKAFDAGWVELARKGIERNIAEPSPFFRNLGENGGGFLSDMWSRRYIPEFERFCMESPVATLAAYALRSNRVRLAQDTWFAKRPGSSERTPWHHDTVISGPFCSVWVALDPTPRASTLEFIRGSHAWGKALMPKSFFDESAKRNAADQFYADFHGDKSRSDAHEFGEIPDIEANRDAYDIIGWDMEPGDCVLFNARTIHGAPGNDSKRTIRRFVTRWITDESVVAMHGQDMIDALVGAGLEIDLQVGGPVRGTLFPEIRVRENE